MENVTNPQLSAAPTNELSQLRAKVASILGGVVGDGVPYEPVVGPIQKMEKDIETMIVEAKSEAIRHGETIGGAMLVAYKVLAVAAAELTKLEAERNAAREKIAKIMAGLEGCCMTCDPVGMRNQQMERDIETIRAERDEARREVCRIQEQVPINEMDKATTLAEDYAEERGWDCFKEDANAR